MQKNTRKQNNNHIITTVTNNNKQFYPVREKIRLCTQIQKTKQQTNIVIKEKLNKQKGKNEIISPKNQKKNNNNN